MTMTYDIALSNYRNAVNRIFPDGEIKKTRRNISKTNTGRGCDGGRGQGGGRGRGRGSFQQNKQIIAFTPLMVWANPSNMELICSM